MVEREVIIKRTPAIFILVLTIIFGCSNGLSEEALQELNQKIQPGDIIFQTSLSGQSKAIQLATNSKYSHMGIVYENDGQSDITCINV